jgi:hypothetical protein
MLTQKGREPFIRMKIFLEDEVATLFIIIITHKIIAMVMTIMIIAAMIMIP